MEIISVIFVSIPLWFDSNSAGWIKWLSKTMYVSIPLWFDSNSTTKTYLIRHISVSIPLWFDSNKRNIFWSQYVTKGSQFHYGSIQIAGIGHCIFQFAMVSIPLWFDSNIHSIEAILPGELVSIPLWFDSNRRKGGYWERSSLVSIPLWFDSNLIESFHNVLDHKRLNSTMVRFKLISTFDKLITIESLNSTMVRFKSFKNKKIMESFYMSQFHYGSIQIFIPS